MLANGRGVASLVGGLGGETAHGVVIPRAAAAGAKGAAVVLPLGSGREPLPPHHLILRWLSGGMRRWDKHYLVCLALSKATPVYERVDNSGEVYALLGQIGRGFETQTLEPMRDGLEQD